MRDKRRYILVRIVPAWLSPQAKDLFFSIQESVNSLFGDATAADIQMAVVYSDNEFGVVRCRRGTEYVLERALATVFSIGEERVAVRTLAVSGTILALKRRIDQLRGQESPDTRELSIGEKTF
jgi:ribonuclease P/MRP protein subunit POP5